MWELDCEEGWGPKNWCFWTVVLEKALETPLDCKEIQPVQGTLKSLLQHHTSKASILRRSAFLTVQLSHPYMTTGKTIALTRWSFVGKVMSLLFNMLSRLVITFLPRSKHLLISCCSHHLQWFWSQKKNQVSHYFHCFPIYLPWSDGTGCHDLSFLNKPQIREVKVYKYCLYVRDA